MKGISLQLNDALDNPRASLEGIQAIWWDTTNPSGSIPQGKSSVVTTDVNGFVNIDISNVTGLAIGALGFLQLYYYDSLDYRNSLIFQSQLAIQDIVSGVALVGFITDPGMVGLSNVDNTSDEDKPVSTLQQAALDLKADIDEPIVYWGITSKSANYQILTTDHTVLVNASSGPITVTLPDATMCSGQVFLVKKVDSTKNYAIIDTLASQTLDGSLTYSISRQYFSLTIQSDGTNFYII